MTLLAGHQREGHGGVARAESDWLPSELAPVGKELCAPGHFDRVLRPIPSQGEEIAVCARPRPKDRLCAETEGGSRTPPHPQAEAVGQVHGCNPGRIAINVD